MHDVVESEVQTLHDMIAEADDDITIGDKTDADFVPKFNRSNASKKAWNEVN